MEPSVLAIGIETLVADDHVAVVATVNFMVTCSPEVGYNDGITSISVMLNTPIW